MAPPDRAPLRRAAIVAAARDLVTEAGLDALSFRRLADRLDVSAPALYAHVKDKDDLLAAIATVELDALAGRFEAVTDSDPTVSLRRYAEAYVAYARSQPTLFAVVATTPPGLAGSRAFAAIVRAAVRRGEPDPAAFARALWSAAHGVATVQRLAPEDGAGEDEQAEPARLLADVVEPLLEPRIRSGKRAGRGSR